MLSIAFRFSRMLLVFFLFGMKAAIAHVQPFHLAGDEDEAPFGFRNEKGEFVGIYVDTLQEALSRMNIKYVLKGYPWTRAQKMVLQGDADAMITVATPARELIAVANTEALATHQWVAFARTDSTRFQQIMNAKKLQDLRGLRILDYLGDGWGIENFAGIDVDRSGSFSQALLKLAAQRGDVFVHMQQPTKYTLKVLQAANQCNPGLHKIVAAPNILDSRKFYLMVGRNSPYVTILPRFDKTIAEMQADGSLQKIKDKYSAVGRPGTSGMTEAPLLQCPLNSNGL